MPAGQRDIVIGGGIQPAAPTTVGTLLVFSNANPPTATDSIYRQAGTGQQRVEIGANWLNAASIPAAALPVIIGNAHNIQTSSGTFDAVVIGRNNVVGASGNNPAQILIGWGLTGTGSTAFRGVIIGWTGTPTFFSSNRSVAIGANMGGGTWGYGDDNVVIGDSANPNATVRCVAVGAASLLSNGLGESVVIGWTAAEGNGTGGQTANVILGAAASTASVASLNSAVVIGRGAQVTATNGVAIGRDAVAAGGGIAIGRSANAAANACVIGSVTSIVNRFAVVRATGPSFLIEAVDTGAADDIGLRLWDITAGTLKQVSRGAVDSGGVGFRVLRVAN